MSEKTVANAVVRIVLDGIEDVIGENGKNALLNYGKMSRLIDDKPDYSFEKNFTDGEYAAIISSIYTIIGLKGSKAIMRQVGDATARRIIDSGVLDSVKDFKKEEKLLKALEIYVMGSGRGKVTDEGGTVVFDNEKCTVCLNIEDGAPVCTFVNGIIDGLAKWAGVEGKRSVETKCKAMGDNSCRHEVLPIE
jgi:predicted hydrocarbon binding protein